MMLISAIALLLEEPEDGLLLKSEDRSIETEDKTSNTRSWSTEEVCTAVCPRLINYEFLALSIRAPVV